MILPEIGGKIWNAIEKRTGKSFIYFTQSVKFRDIATPVDCAVRTNADGSVTCVIGARDLLTRTPWRLEFRLGKDDAAFSRNSFWYNASPLEQPYYSWMNAGIKVRGDLHFVYPGTSALGHAGEHGPWPLDGASRGLSWYDNNNFGGFKSYHVFGQATDVVGAYWHDDDYFMMTTTAWCAMRRATRRPAGRSGSGDSRGRNDLGGSAHRRRRTVRRGAIGTVVQPECCGEHVHAVQASRLHTAPGKEVVYGNTPKYRFAPAMTVTHPLQLSAADMRALGTRALEMVIRHFEHNRDDPTAKSLTRDETEALLRTALPEAGTPVDELLDVLARDVFPNAFKADHPRFYAFVPSPTNFVSVIGDFLTSGHNVFAGHWLAGSAAAQIELNVLDWLKELCGLPAQSGGILVSGGSMANLSAIATAREAKLGGPNERAVVYCSDQTHSSMAKGLRIIGFRPEQRRTVDTDSEFRLSISALEAAIAADRAAGRLPFAVVANGGTTNTGAVDPLHALADLCAREDLWLHVDGAYGAAAVLTDRGRTALAGLERADSITLDPHKWLFQPYELGCLLVRDADHLRHAFRVEDDDHADYLADVTRHIQNDVNFFERGVQLTRSFKALKLWLSMRTFGVAEFRRAINIGFDMADIAEQRLREDPRWELVTPSQMGVLTFRWLDDTKTPAEIDAITQDTVERMRHDGYALVMSTVLRGRPALRLCPINPTTNVDEITETIARLTRFSLAAADGTRALYRPARDHGANGERLDV